jgi:phosphonate transport system substrate-binding protein
MKTRILSLVILFTSLLVLSGQAMATINRDHQGDALVFGIAPGKDPEQTSKHWGAIISYLSSESGVKLRLKMAASFEAFEKQLAAGAYDIVYMNPYQYTTYHKSKGYMAFAKERNKKVKGIIVVRKDSPYKSLADLKDQTVAFPKEDVFGASVLPRASLKQEKIPVKSKDVDSSTSVYRAVYKGKLPAGGGVMDTYGKLNPAVNNNLRILWTTKQYTPDAFAAHPRVASATLDKLKSAMFVMQDEPNGLSLLNTINFKGIEAAEDKEWDDIRALRLKLTE